VESWDEESEGVAEDDEAMMGHAACLGDGARRRTPPNPWVGAVVVAAGPSGPVVVGGGATEAPGGRHAEVVALEEAGALARGATLYVTLEPCNHEGRTGPCVAAIVGAGITRVVVGVADPDPAVDGKGIEALVAAGIEVRLGVLASRIADQLAAYLHHRRTGRPRVVLKLAMTLDGRIAAPDGSSRWITGPLARRDVHRLRAEVDAILVGAGTIRSDDPALRVRLDGWEGIQPLRVVLGTAPKEAAVHPALELGGDLRTVLEELGHRGVLEVLVEGGARVAHDLHADGLVDRYVIYLAPALFGGDDARAAFVGPGAPSVDQLWRGRLVAVERLGQDLKMVIDPPR